MKIDFKCNYCRSVSHNTMKELCCKNRTPDQMADAERTPCLEWNLSVRDKRILIGRMKRGE